MRKPSSLLAWYNIGRFDPHLNSLTNNYMVLLGIVYMELCGNPYKDSISESARKQTHFLMSLTALLHPCIMRGLPRYHAHSNLQAKRGKIKQINRLNMYKIISSLLI